MFRFVLPAIALLAGGAALSADDQGYRERQAAADQARLDKALTGFTPGRTTDCIEQSRARSDSVQRFGDKLVYRYSPREVYVTDTGGGCFGLRRGDAIITRTFGTQFCRGDIVRTADLVSQTPSGSCSFGAFQQYTK